MQIPEADVLYEDNHLLAFNKPAGILSMGDDTGDVTMVEIAADYLRRKYNKPGNVFVGVVHRLDRPVSGVLLFARTSKAASRLSDQFRRDVVKKTYRAVVSGSTSARHAELVDWLLKNHQTNVVSVVREGTPGAQRCVLKYTVVKREQNRLHLDVEPITGRSHQIRVQLANRKLPIIGDVKYGSPQRQPGRIALHARELTIQHPTTREPLRIECPVPDDLAASATSFQDDPNPETRGGK
ncbi:MAG: RluA family pseudouridine synthase [Planctomycetaceae bacterium]